MLSVLRVVWTSVALTAAALAPIASYMASAELDSIIEPISGVAITEPAFITIAAAVFASMLWWLLILAVWAPGALILLFAGQFRKR